jgi:hypothetical protein
MAANYDDMSFTPPYLATIAALTLIIHGDRDHFFPVSIAVELYQALPRAHLWVIPNAFHLDKVGGYRDDLGQGQTALFREYFTQTVVDFLAHRWVTADS